MGSFNNHVDDVNENARHIIRYISLTSTVTRIMPCDVLWRALKHVHNNDNFFSSLLNFNTALKNSTSRKFAYKRNRGSINIIMFERMEIHCDDFSVPSSLWLMKVPNGNDCCL